MPEVEREPDYFQVHGLETNPPAELNAALVRAIDELRPGLPAEAEEELTETELELLEKLGVAADGETEGDDPVTAMVLSHAALVETGWSVTETAERIGLSSGRVRQLLGDRELYGFHIDGRWVIPSFQFRRSAAGWRLLEGIRAVNKALPADLHPTEVAAWYQTPEPELAEQDSTAAPTPLTWLRAGRSQEALAALAGSVGEPV